MGISKIKKYCHCHPKLCNLVDTVTGTDCWDVSLNEPIFENSWIRLPVTRCRDINIFLKSRKTMTQKVRAQ
jgi:hypothetical protein